MQLAHKIKLKPKFPFLYEEFNSARYRRKKWRVIERKLPFLYEEFNFANAPCEGLADQQLIRLIPGT